MIDMSAVCDCTCDEVIHPNGGFTIVWLTLKTLVFPVIVITLLWFIWRISHLDRKPNVLEQYEQ